ncbi:hypothetical protein H312_02905 [Anncaliia algerae PRA339]|uniref:Uncharacterized protein n=1 Tax=Anncaliia algerae PRA339 TaxID=1288291 RepID=A0A059EXV3_9MICR|nr:hypothetical protein H312_02905 [Anncaliia algerae PRA339]
MKHLFFSECKSLMNIVIFLFFYYCMNDYNVKLISNDNEVMESDGHFVPNGSEKDTKKPHENNLQPNEDNTQPKSIPSQPMVVTPAPQIQNTAQTTPLIPNNIPTSTPVTINQPVIAQTPTNPSKHNIEEPTEEVTDEGEEENGSHGDHMDISDELFAEIQKDDSLKIYDKNNRTLSESDNGDRLIWLAEDIGTRFYHPGKDDELNIIKTTKGKCLKRIKNGVFLRDCDKAGNDPSFLFRMNLSERGMRPKKSPKAKDKDEEENHKEKSEETKKEKPKKKIHKNHDISTPEEENLSDTEDLEIKNKKDSPHKESLDSPPNPFGNPTIYALPYFFDKLTENTSELKKIEEKIGNNCHKENNKEGEVLNSVVKELKLIEDHLKKMEEEKDSKKTKKHSSSNNDEEENEKNKEKPFDNDKMLKIISDLSSRITNTLPPSQPAYNPPPNNQPQPMNNQPYINQPQPVYNQPYNNQQQPMNNQPYTNQPQQPTNNQPYTNQPQQNQSTPNNLQQSSPPPSSTTNPLDLISQIIKLSPSNQASSFINSMNQNKNPNNIIG